MPTKVESNKPAPKQVEFTEISGREYITFHFPNGQTGETSYTIWGPKQVAVFQRGYIIVNSNGEVFLIDKWGGQVMTWKVPYGNDPLTSYDYDNPF